MNPPSPFAVCETAVQFRPAEVCLNDARVVPVCISCTDIVPGPVIEDDDAVEHSMISCRCMVVVENQVD